jgi:hypothetical protein
MTWQRSDDAKFCMMSVETKTVKYLSHGFDDYGGFIIFGIAHDALFSEYVA